MGGSSSKDGCPPTWRWRGWNEWDGDLCNMGYKVVSTKEYINATTIKPTALVNMAIDNAEQALSDGVHSFGSSIWDAIEVVEKLAEIAIILVAAALLFIAVMWVINIFRRTYKCATRFNGSEDNV